MIIYPDYNDMKNPNILILTGGVGPEREVSLSTGKALLDSLKKYFDVSLIDLKEERLPENLNPKIQLFFQLFMELLEKTADYSKCLKMRVFFMQVVILNPVVYA